MHRVNSPSAAVVTVITVFILYVTPHAYAGIWMDDFSDGNLPSCWSECTNYPFRNGSLTWGGHHYLSHRSACCR